MTGARLVVLCALLASLHGHAEVGAITGGPGALRDVVRGYLTPVLDDCTEVDEDLNEAVDEALREAFDATGYFGGSATPAWAPEAPCTLTVELKPGVRSRIARWDITAEPLTLTAEDSRWLAAQAATGGDFDPTGYETQKRRVLSTLKDRGYLDTAFTETIVDVDPDTATAHIDWRIAPGPQYVISDVTIDQSTLDDELFQRFLTLQAGKVLTTADMVTTYDNLAGSDYFSRVFVQTQPDARRDGTIPVEITARPAERWSYLAGVGFATDSGPRLRAEANARYLNRRGHRFGSNLTLAPVRSELRANYRRPYGDPRHEWDEATISLSREDTDTALANTFGVGLKRTQRIRRRWAQTWYTGYTVEDFDIATQDDRSSLWLFGTNLTYTSTIDAPRPRGGRSFSVDLRGAHEALLSDTNLVQLRASAKQILPFLGGMRWLLRADAGVTWGADFEALPVSLRFFSGGDSSVRGYALDTIGPEDENGDVIGGERLLNASVELDIPVRENWAVALFADAGSAYDTSPEFSESVGIGVRWFSPLGPIRVDLAHPLEDTGQTVRLHISLGPDI